MTQSPLFIKVIVILLMVSTSLTVAAQQPPADDSPSTSAQDMTYTVRANDTLDTIGAFFNRDADCIATANNLSSDQTLTIGQTLAIPADCGAFASAATASTADRCDYSVQLGDTLDTIAQRLDISLTSLMRANNRTHGRDLFVGDCLIIPADAPAYGMTPALMTASGADNLGQGGAIVPGELYVMQYGDVLDVIAQNRDVSLAAILLANNMTRGDVRGLMPGTVIIIPDDAPSYGMTPLLDQPALGQLYTVRSGESLDVIAQRFDVSLALLQLVNNISPGEVLAAGRMILIPNDAPAYGDDDLEALGQGGGADPGVQPYVVQYGDVLSVIAQEQGLDLSCLIEVNALSRPGELRPGQTLLLPDRCRLGAAAGG